MAPPVFFYRAETEDGHSVEEPPSSTSPRHIVISLMPDGTFEVEYEDVNLGEHRIDIETETTPQSYRA